MDVEITFDGPILAPPLDEFNWFFQTGFSNREFVSSVLVSPNVIRITTALQNAEVDNPFVEYDNNTGSFKDVFGREIASFILEDFG